MVIGNYCDNLLTGFEDRFLQVAKRFCQYVTYMYISCPEETCHYFSPFISTECMEPLVKMLKKDDQHELLEAATLALANLTNGSTNNVR